MSLIWRCAAKAAKESLVNRVPIVDLLKSIGWEVNPRAEPLEEDMTAKELTAWVQRNAVEVKREHT